jgi:hypothetical protein
MNDFAQGWNANETALDPALDHFHIQSAGSVKQRPWRKDA